MYARTYLRYPCQACAKCRQLWLPHRLHVAPKFVYGDEVFRLALTVLVRPFHEDDWPFLEFLSAFGGTDGTMVSITHDDLIRPIKIGTLHASGLYIEDEECVVRLLDRPGCLRYA